jgi:hypothetical protein
MTKHVIKTSVGLFTFGWADSKHSWIYGRFEQPDRAKRYFDCNKYSGKYNFHTFPLMNLMNTLQVLNSLK